MRELYTNATKPHLPRSDVAKPDRLQAFAAQSLAIYCSFLLIAAVVFGTLSFRPF